jgi:hypothetical protein
MVGKTTNKRASSDRAATRRVIEATPKRLS